MIHALQSGVDGGDLESVNAKPKGHFVLEAWEAMGQQNRTFSAHVSREEPCATSTSSGMSFLESRWCRVADSLKKSPSETWGRGGAKVALRLMGGLASSSEGLFFEAFAAHLQGQGCQPECDLALTAQLARAQELEGLEKEKPPRR